MYEIIIYEDKKGESELENYIIRLKQNSIQNKEDRIKFNKIIAYIRMLKEKGLSLGKPFIKHLDDNIWELRPMKDRILLARLENKKIILLHYFRKETQKTPKREIAKAKANFYEYKERGK